MQLRWPAHLVFPEFLYATSNLAQRVSTATGADLKHANGVLANMQKLAKNGGAKLKTYPLKGQPLFASYFDASLGSLQP